MNMAFTDAVKAKQSDNGSANHYEAALARRAERKGELETDDVFGPDERAFIESRDSFYMATVNSDDWPYLQHRGGPPGFLRVIDDTTLLMPEFRGNRQYVSLGNLAGNNRVSLFLMDYPRQARLKIYARVREIDLNNDQALMEKLASPAYPAPIERALEFTMEAYDWNCPKYITPRYTEADVQTVTQKMVNRIAQLEAEVERLRAKLV